MIEWTFDNPYLAALLGGLLVAIIFIVIDCVSSFFVYGEWL